MTQKTPEKAMTDQNSDNIKNSEILETLENRLTENENETSFEKKVKFIIFNIDDHLYAMDGSYVQEIILNYPIFYLPFAPPYVRGLINRHGDPYTVVDLKILFHTEELKASTFLVLRNNIDNLSFIISSINKIVNIPEKDVHPITSKDDTMDYFESSITLDDSEIFVVNIKTVIERIVNDIE